MNSKTGSRSRRLQDALAARGVPVTRGNSAARRVPVARIDSAVRGVLLARATPVVLGGLVALAALAPRPAAARQVAAPGAAAPAEVTVNPEEVRAALSVLAADSLEGRATGTRGAARAARFIAAELRRHGVDPAGDDGYLQTVALARTTMPNGRTRLVRLPDLGALDTIPAERQVMDANVVGIIPGSDPALRDEVVLISAHYDHVGIGRPVNGDSIYNGADDDASGVVAVLEIARALKSGPAPKRTVVFLLATGEEVGLLGTRWFIDHPPVPLERVVANLEVEMIGRPDSLAGGPGKAWLTGYERSTMGEMLRDGGIPIVADPRPEQNFFMRSDNIAFAYRGIPAHTLSSFNLHEDYHRPSDEVDKVDFEHMARVIEAAIQATRLLTDGDVPVWHPGGRPEPPAGRR